MSSGHHPYPGKGVHAFLSLVITLKWPSNALSNPLVFDNAKVLCPHWQKSWRIRSGKMPQSKKGRVPLFQKAFYSTSWLKRKFKYTFSVPSSSVNGSFRASFFSVGASALISSLHVLKYQPFTRPSWSNCGRPKVLLALGLKWISKAE